MSWRLVQDALDASVRPLTRKLVLIRLAHHAQHDGTRAHPGRQALMRSADASARTVTRQLDALEHDDKLLREVRRAHTGQAREFAIDVERLRDLAEEAVQEGAIQASPSRRARGGHPGQERETFRAGEGDIPGRRGGHPGGPPTSENVTNVKANYGEAPQEEPHEVLGAVALDRVPSTWPRLPDALADSSLDPTILHLLNRIAVATPVTDADVPVILGLVHDHGTPASIRALRSIVEQHVVGDGEGVRSLIRLLRFALKEAQR